MYRKANKEKLEFLNGYRRAKSRSEAIRAVIDQISIELNTLRSESIGRVMPKSPAISDMPKSHESTDKMADTLSELADIELVYKQKVSELVEKLRQNQQVMAQVSNAINRVKDPDLQKILTLHFIRLRSWQETASDCGYSLNTLKRYKKADAINAIRIRTK